MILFLMTHKQLQRPAESIAFIELLARQGVDIEIGCYEQLSTFVSINERRMWINGKDLSEYEAVYFRGLSHSRGLAALCALYLTEKNVPFVDQEAATPQSFSKMQQMYLLAQNGVSVAPSFCGDSALLADILRDGKLTFPLVVKGNVASRGRNNFLVKNNAELQTILAKKPQGYFIVQPAIANDGDYRVLVLGGQAKWAMHRQRQSDDTHLNNTSQGAQGTVVAVHEAPLGAVLDNLQRAATIFGRDIAGVDVMFDKHTGDYYILEVNRSPQLSTGAHVPAKIAALAEYLESLNGRNHDSD